MDFTNSNKGEKLAVPAAESVLRRSARVAVAIRAVLYHGEKFQPVVIQDISAGGARLHGCDCLMVSDPVTIRLLSGRALQARVRWWLGGACGVQFDTPLSEQDALLSGRLDYDRLLAERREAIKSAASPRDVTLVAAKDARR